MCLLIKIATDSNKEFKNYYYNFKKNVKNYISNNIDLFIYLFGLSLNKNFLQEVFNNITIYLDSNKVFSSYINSQETTVVATWLSNQYHNNLGINFLNNKDYESALIEFYKTIVICESIKCMGHWHRFTARAYNNTVSALIGLYNKNANFPQCITNDSLLLPVINLIGSKSSEYAYFAKLYVDIAVEIIQHCKCKDDVQAMYIYHNAGYPIHGNTTAEYFQVGDDMFPVLVRELEQAQHYIFIEYFIIHDGVMWRTILDILERKVQEGVDVRLIYDDMGCLTTLPHKYYETMRSKGIKCQVFNPFRPILNIIQNNRDHRKFCIIDGYVGFTGGVNLADEYINQKERFGHWKDTAVMLKGEAESGT